MRKLLNKFISNTKNENYEIDKSVPTCYLIGLCFSKVGELHRGFWTRIFFKRKHKGKKVFIGRGTRIKCKRKVSCGRGVTIGKRCYINALSSQGIQIGSNVSIGRDSDIECTGVIRAVGEGLIIEDNVGIAPHAFIACRGLIRIGKDTIVGPYVKMHSENHNYSDPNVPIKDQGETRKGITIGKNCWIGSNVTILDGVTIGDGAIIGAGAVVNKNVESNTIVGGVPAKFIKNRI